MMMLVETVEGPTFAQTGVNREILVSLEPLVGLWCQRRPQIKVYSTFHKTQFFLPPSCQAPGPFWRGLPLFPFTDCSPCRDQLLSRGRPLGRVAARPSPTDFCPKWSKPGSEGVVGTRGPPTVPTTPVFLGLLPFAQKLGLGK